MRHEPDGSSRRGIDLSRILSSFPEESAIHFHPEDVYNFELEKPLMNPSYCPALQRH